MPLTDTESTQAATLAGGPMLAATGVTGAAVFNQSSERVGRIEDVAISQASGGVDYVVLSRGGFLGLRTRLYAIPWRMLRFEAAARVFVVPDGWRAHATRLLRDRFVNWSMAAPPVGPRLPLAHGPYVPM